MRIDRIIIASLLAAGSGPLLLQAARPEPRLVRMVDTVFVKPAPIDYDELARGIARIQQAAAKPTVIEGDLIVKGRLGVGGPPEPGTDYGITVRAPNSAAIRLISNEALADPQRAGNQHRHVGA
ncbi:MAG TPA: hypothetical protein VFT21_10015, partial [Gemmatimonadaceae bacterium]|nr:hypothetical protein [Gemmatimonadaceae bacterium]